MTNTKSKERRFPEKDLIKVDDLQDMVDGINTGWRKAKDGFMDVAKLCADASRSLGSEERKKLISRLPFDEPTFSKFVKIGSNQRLMKPEILNLLPSHYTIVYLVAQLSDEDLDAALAKGTIHPKMKRSDLEQRRRPGRGSPQKALTHETAVHDDIVTDQGVSPDRHESDDSIEAIVRAWNAASPAARARFLREYVECAVPPAIAA